MTECESCPFKLWPTWCYAASSGHAPLCRPKFRAIVAAETLGTALPPPPKPVALLDSKVVARIVLCSARESDCNCLGKQATCRPHGRHPGPVHCLTAGPGGTPCGGV